ncbi:hypothetical protein [Kocuria sp. TGY1127_2]|uniref:hypothetical protein n=1 Tax=Kocuria sp. TGY1127_2 TaxID=2711328 RepID=UPI0015BA1C07|nr:hypothetical protein [Kocuria sp. TGY1127_2]
MTTKNEPIKADATITDIVAEIVDLDNEIAPLQARRDELNKHLRNLEPGKYHAGAFEITVSESKRFNKKRFEQDFPPAAHRQFYEETEPQMVLVKDRISKAVQDDYSDRYDNRVTVK